MVEKGHAQLVWFFFGATCTGISCKRADMAMVGIMMWNGECSRWTMASTAVYTRDPHREGKYCKSNGDEPFTWIAITGWDKFVASTSSDTDKWPCSPEVSIGYRCSIGSVKFTAWLGLIGGNGGCSWRSP